MMIGPIQLLASSLVLVDFFRQARQPRIGTKVGGKRASINIFVVGVATSISCRLLFFPPNFLTPLMTRLPRSGRHDRLRPSFEIRAKILAVEVRVGVNFIKVHHIVTVQAASQSSNRKEALLSTDK